MKVAVKVALTILLLVMTHATSWGVKKKSTTPDFNYPQTVSTTARQDLDAALKSGDGAKTIDALVRASIAESMVSKDNVSSIISRVDSVIKLEKRHEYVALLRYFKARILRDYSTYGFWGRDAVEGTAPAADYSEWSNDQFQAAIAKLSVEALSDKDVLLKASIEDYPSIINYSEEGLAMEPTLYHFLCEEFIDLLDDTQANRKSAIYKDWIANSVDNAPAAVYARTFYVQSGVYISDSNEDYVSNDDEDFDDDVSNKSLSLRDKAFVDIYNDYSASEYSGYALANVSNRSLYNTYKQYVERFPDSEFALPIKSIIADIESKNVSVSYKSDLYSTDSIEVEVKAKNVKQAQLSLYRVPEAIYFDTKSYNYKLSQLKLIESLTVQLSEKTDEYGYVTTKASFAPQKYGAYVVVCSFKNPKGVSETSKPTRYQVLAVHDIVLFSVAIAPDDKTKKSTKLFAVDMKTGAPVSGVGIFSSSNKNTVYGVTDSKGMVRFNTTFSRDRVRARKGNDIYGPEFGMYSFNNYATSRQTMASIFTDLAIYRPGETVKFGAILYSVGISDRSVVAGDSVKVEFSDANSKLIDSLTLVTDAFGRVNGEFKVPVDRLNGAFSITVKQNRQYKGSKSINVSEYKTPSFEVSFEGAKDHFVNGQPIKITGKVATYSGMPVADANVRLQLRKNVWSWWGVQTSSGNVLMTDTVATDADGKFSVELPADLFAVAKDGVVAYKYIANSYTLKAECTDGAGETQDGSHNFIVGDKSEISITNYNVTACADSVLTLPVQYNTTTDNASAICRYEIIEKKNKKVVASGTFSTADCKVDLSSVASGVYGVSMWIDGDTANKVAIENLVLYHTADKVPPMRTSMWLPEAMRSVDAKGVAHIKIGVNAPESHIYYVATSSEKLLGEGWLNYKAGMHDFSIQIPDAANDFVTVEFVTYFDNEAHEETVTMRWPAKQEKLTVKAVSFRDKTTAGSREHWTLQLLDKDNKPVNGAMIMGITDNAVNSLSNNLWNFSPNFLGRSLSKIDVTRLFANKNAYAAWRAETKGYSDVVMPEFNLYEKNLFNRRPRILVRGYTSLNAANDNIAAAPMVLEESVVVKKEAKTSARVMNKLQDADASLGSISSATGASLDNVAVRTADVKTASWRPELTADADGNVQIEFDVPNFNTTWKVQAQAWSKSLTTDVFNAQVLSSKPLMVKSSLPRFVRQSDNATFSANVQNATDSVLSCTALLEVYDPRTDKVLASETFSPVIAAKGTEVLSINYNVPDTLAFVGVRVRASNNVSGDGEQTMLPVLQAISPVVESRPFYLDAGTKQYQLTLPEFATGSRVTLEYCDNPIWYCVTALPTIFDENAHVSTALAHSLWAISVARGIVAKQPAIKTAVADWNADKADSTLTSMLQKNADLKIGTLLASPWLTEAERQTLRMSRLGELTDSAKSAATTQKLIKALKAMQLNDGGFVWYRYPQCKSSVWTTGVVLQLLGELKQLGFLPADDVLATMISSAIKYYDREILNSYNEMLKKKVKVNYYSYSDYVYVRTLHSDLKMGDQNKDIFNKALTAMKTGWKDCDIMEKAYVAISLSRNGYNADAKKITESIRQFAITKPETGMYWDNIDRGWSRYFDKATVTSTVLEALNEVDGRQQEVDDVRKWLLLQKQTNDWGSSSLAAHAVYSLLLTGTNWLHDNTEAKISLDYGMVEFDKVSKHLGYCRTSIPAHSKGIVKIERDGNNPGWGAVYAQYNAPMSAVKEHKIGELQVTKEYFVRQADGKLKAVSEFKVGDRVTVRTVIKNSRDMDFVTMTDERAACMEPVDQISGYRAADGSYFYLETKDSSTNLFFDYLHKGTHVITYDVHVTAAGTYQAGIATVQCQYAPQMTAHTAGKQLVVAPKGE